MRREVERDFNAYLKRLLASKPTVLKYVHHHERKTLCIDNLCREIRQAELSFHGFEKDRRLYLIQQTAQFFASQALKWAEEQALSALERTRLVDAAKEEDISDLMIEGSTRVTEL